MQDELGLLQYDFVARLYNPELGIFGTPDPLAEQSRRWGTYLYCFNNPLRFVDPDGRNPFDPTFLTTVGVLWESFKSWGSDLKGATERLSSGQSGELPKDIDIAPSTRSVVKALGTMQDAAIVGEAYADIVTAPLNLPGVDMVGDPLMTGIGALSGNWEMAATYGAASLIPGVSGGAAKLGKEAIKGLGNPFKNMTLKEVEKAFEKHVKSGKLLKGEISGTGGLYYKNTKSGYSYYLDNGIHRGKITEPPHIDLNYPNKYKPKLEKKKLYVK